MPSTAPGGGRGGVALAIHRTPIRTAPRLLPPVATDAGVPPVHPSGPFLPLDPVILLLPAPPPPSLLTFVALLHNAFALFGADSPEELHAPVVALGTAPRAPPPMYSLDFVTGELRGGGVMPTTALELFLDAFGGGYLSASSRAALETALRAYECVPFPNLVGLLLYHMVRPYAAAKLGTAKRAETLGAEMGAEMASGGGGGGAGAGTGTVALQSDEMGAAAADAAAVLAPSTHSAVPSATTTHEAWNARGLAATTTRLTKRVTKRHDGAPLAVHADTLCAPLGTAPLAALHTAFALFDGAHDGAREGYVRSSELDLVFGDLEIRHLPHAQWRRMLAHHDAGPFETAAGGTAVVVGSATTTATAPAALLSFPHFLQLCAAPSPPPPPHADSEISEIEELMKARKALACARPLTPATTARLQLVMRAFAAPSRAQSDAMRAVEASIPSAASARADDDDTGGGDGVLHDDCMLIAC